jgi:phage shock protein E
MRLLAGLFGKTDNTELSAIINEGAFLVDVRTPAEFLEGSAKGAVNIPLSSILTQLGKFKDKNYIIVFCRSGNRSEEAKNILERNGFPNVINGGIRQNVERSGIK